MKHNKFIQFQLWRDCQSKCDFCYNKGIIATDKARMCDFVLERLSWRDIGTEYVYVGFIGGEFFAGQIDTDDVRTRFYKIVDLCVDYLKTNKIAKVFVTTNLMYKRLDELERFIDKFHESGQLSNLIICTSYDTLYRFQNNRVEQLWRDNIKKLQQKYSSINIHVETILTEHFMNRVLDDTFNIDQFKNDLNVSIDFIDCQYFSDNTTKQNINRALPDFVPKRSTFIAFVKKLIKEKQYNVKQLLNQYHHSNLIYFEENGNIVEIGDRNVSQNGLDSYYKSLGRKGFKTGYVDSDVMPLDDVQTILSMIN